MKKLLILLATILAITHFSAQGKSISVVKKSFDPIELENGSQIHVDDEISIGLGSNPDGSFRFVQFLNGLNEPIKAADSRASLTKQKIKFFKKQEGVDYVFTKYFVINIEAALELKEIKSITPKGSKLK